MRARAFTLAAAALLIFCLGTLAVGQEHQTPLANDVVSTLVARLELERFKATLQGLTRFGDRRQGTQIARIFNAPDVQTERSIRFILWNNEETGLNGSRAGATIAR